MTTVGLNGLVEFRFFRPNVTGVKLAGDFTGWVPQDEMRSDSPGWWKLDLRLAPGEYRFRYVADGQWYTDFAANGVESSETGWNSVRVVPPAGEVMGEAVDQIIHQGGRLKVA